MKRIITFVLLCSFAAAWVQTAGAQSRPRRVGVTPPPQQQDQQTQPQQTSTQSQPQTDDPAETARPARPPVLGGANRDPNEQKPASTSTTKDPANDEISAGDVVRVDTTLVSIPVSVMDRDGKYIPNLTKDDFHVWENGVEQKVAYFASTEKPFTVALVIDTSASTRYKLEEIQDAAIAFVNQLRPDDRVMVVSFDDKIRTLAQPTNDRAVLRSAILQTKIGSGTKLYEAVDQVIGLLSRIEGRKAIVLFTDGVDTTSRHATYESTVSKAEELDALIYPVEYDTYSDMGGGSRRGGGGGGGGGGNTGSNGGGAIISILGAILGGGGGGSYPGGNGRGGGGGRNGGGNWPGGRGAGGTKGEYERADLYLHDLARVTGARLYNAEQENLDAAFRSVAEELRRQYSLGYYPKNAPHPGERREIKVRVNRPELVVRTKDSYVFQQGANTTAQSGNNQPAKPPVLKKDFSGGR